MDIGKIPDIAVAFVVIYWVLVQMFPQLDIKRLINKGNGNVTKQDWELLFKKYDTLIDVVSERNRVEMDKISNLINPIMTSIQSVEDVVKSFSSYIERTEAVLKEIKFDIKRLVEKLDAVNTSIEIIKDRRRK